MIFGELIKVTRTTKFKSHGSNSGYLYHILAGGVHGQYKFHSAHADTTSLVCTGKNCKARFTIESGFNETNGRTPAGKTKYKQRTDIPETDFLSLESYGLIKHVCTDGLGPRACRQRANGLCSKTEHSSECTTSSLTENWAHHEISLRLKKRRKVERVQPARVLVSEEVERFRSAYGPEEHLPEDFNVQHNVNKKRLATVIHERDQIDKPECSAGGVPLDLIRYPVSTDHDGNIVTEQLIYEFPDFTAFIRVQNLI